MFGLGDSGRKKLGQAVLPWQKHWQGMLADYVTSLQWSADGSTLAAASAAGEVVLWQDEAAEKLHYLELDSGESIDVLSFSGDSQFLAASGSAGTVKIWQLSGQKAEVIATLKSERAWIDKLAWSPTENLLAYSPGKQVCLWDLETKETVAKLDFDQSSVLALAWHPLGEYLAVAGNQGVKMWDARDWQEDPYCLDIPSVSVAVAWSPEGQYLATGNMDSSLVVVDIKNPHPWVMRGFYGKVRQLAWCDRPTVLGTPLLAVCHAESIAVWEKQFGPNSEWDAWELEGHLGVVQAIGFQPGTFHLASAAEDGQVCIWRDAEQVWQLLGGAPDGFSTLAIHPQGKAIAAAGVSGELIIWFKSTAGQGFSS